MSLSQFIRHVAKSRHRNLILVGVLVTLTVVTPFFVFSFTQNLLDRIDERTLQAEREDRARQEEDLARQIHDLLTNPKSGTSPEQIAALSIGMTAKEVQSILGFPYSLGIGIFPYGHTTYGHRWVPNDIPIKDVGWIQAVFIESQLVGLGSLDPNDGRLCGGCLEDMLYGERAWLEGLPYQVEGKCPVCGTSKVVSYGGRWGPRDRDRYLPGFVGGGIVEH